MEEAGGEEKGEGKRKKKKRSKKTAAAIEEDEQGGGKEDEGPSLIDIGSRETSPAPAAALAAKTESPRKKSPAREAKKEGECTCTYHQEHMSRLKFAALWVAHMLLIPYSWKFSRGSIFIDRQCLLDPSKFDTVWVVKYYMDYLIWRIPN